MVQARPWLGIGPGNDAFNQIYPLFQQPKFNALSAYSIPLELAVEAGLPGLLAGSGLLLARLRSAPSLWRRERCVSRPGRARKLFALTSLVLGVAALVLTFSRGAWMGLVAEAAVILLLLAVRATLAAGASRAEGRG